MLAICKLSRDRQLALAANLHAGDTEVPSCDDKLDALLRPQGQTFDDLAGTKLELERRSADVLVEDFAAGELTNVSV